MKYFLPLFFLFLASCATEEHKPEVKTYSDETNRAFEMIERGGSYYLKKAPTSTTPPQVRMPLPKVEKVETVKSKPKEDIVIDEKINYQEKAPGPAATSGPAQIKVRPQTKTDERLIEINQNLAFYCMKHRKDFADDENKCMRFVNKTLATCQKIHHIVNSKLLSCIQTKLKNKR